MMGLFPLSGEIEIGQHVEKEFLGMTFNMDTIWATLIAGSIVLGLGFWARVKLTKDNTLGALGGDPCTPGPILLQYNGSPVQLRNLWLVPLK